MPELPEVETVVRTLSKLVIGKTIAHCRIVERLEGRPKTVEGKSMDRKIVRTIALASFALAVVLSTAWQAQAQGAKASYPSMAPLDQYLMTDRNCHGAECGAGGNLARCRCSRPRTAWLRNRSQRQERFRVCRGARVDVPIRW